MRQTIWVAIRNIMGRHLGHHPRLFGVANGDATLCILGRHLRYKPIYFGQPFGLPFGAPPLTGLHKATGLTGYCNQGLVILQGESFLWLSWKAVHRMVGWAGVGWTRLGWAGLGCGDPTYATTDHLRPCPSCAAKQGSRQELCRNHCDHLLQSLPTLAIPYIIARHSTPLHAKSIKSFTNWLMN